MAAAVFDLDACEPLHFTVTNGPVLTSGPPATQFGLLASPVVADPHIDQKARVWFTYTGTAADDMAEGTATIRLDETGDPFDVILRANTIERPTAAIAMVLDQSNSMTFDSGLGAGITRGDVLKFSAPTAVVVLDDANAMAVCSFDHDPHPGIGMTDAAGIGKLTITGAIQSYAPNPNGWTSIGEAVAFAHGIVNPVTTHQIKAMVVLTDGAEVHGPHTRRYIADVADEIASMNGRVFAIGLGRAEVLNPAALQALCSGNNGYMLMTGDLTANATYRLAKYYQQIFAGATNHDIVLDPEGYVGPGPEIRIPFWLSETDISAKAIVLSPAPHAITFRLETPQGDIIDPATAGAHPTLAFEMAQQVALYRVGLPVPLAGGSAHAGRWYARLGIEPRYYKRYLSVARQPASGARDGGGARHPLQLQRPRLLEPADAGQPLANQQRAGRDDDGPRGADGVRRAGRGARDVPCGADAARPHAVHAGDGRSAAGRVRGVDCRERAGDLPVPHPRRGADAPRPAVHPRADADGRRLARRRRQAAVGPRRAAKERRRPPVPADRVSARQPGDRRTAQAPGDRP